MAFVVFVLHRPLMILTKRDWRWSPAIPTDGGLVIAVNHVSEFDPVPFGHFVYDHGRIPRFLGKASVFKVPVIGQILSSAGQIPVYRETDEAAKAFRAAESAASQGEVVVFYPEGTLTRDPGMWPMVGKSGAARVALATGCPLVPCAQWGPQEILAPYGRRPRLLPRKVMRIRAGDPVDLSDLASQPLTPAVLAVATARLMTAITVLLEEIRGEQAPFERFDPRVAGVATTGNPNKARNKPGRAAEKGRGGAEPPRLEGEV